MRKNTKVTFSLCVCMRASVIRSPTSSLCKRMNGKAWSAIFSSSVAKHISENTSKTKGKHRIGFDLFVCVFVYSFSRFVTSFTHTDTEFWQRKKSERNWNTKKKQKFQKRHRRYLQRPKLFQICINTNWMTSVSAVGCRRSLLWRYLMIDFSNLSNSSRFAVNDFFRGSVPGDFTNKPNNRRTEVSISYWPLELNGGILATHELHLHSK